MSHGSPDVVADSGNQDINAFVNLLGLPQSNSLLILIPLCSQYLLP